MNLAQLKSQMSLSSAIPHPQQESRKFQWTHNFNKSKTIMHSSYQSSPSQIKSNMKTRQMCHEDNKIHKQSQRQSHEFGEDIKNKPIKNKDNKKKEDQLTKSGQKQWYQKIMFPSKLQKTIQKRLQEMLQQQIQKGSRRTKYYTVSTQCENTTLSRHYFDQTIKSSQSMSKNSTLRKYLCEQSLNKCVSQWGKVKSSNKQSNESNKNSQKKVSCFNLYQHKQQQMQSIDKKELLILQGECKKYKYLHKQLISVAKDMQSEQGSTLTEEIMGNPEQLILIIKQRFKKMIIGDSFKINQQNQTQQAQN